MQAISCVVATPFHVLTASEDSNVHVWSLSSLLDIDSTGELEPERTLSNHRAAVTSLVVGQSTNTDTSICISASRDKTCVIWNYRTGEALRTLLFSASPLCLSIDPCGRAFYAGTEDSAVYMVALFGDRPLIGGSSENLASTVQIKDPFGICDSDAGPPSCLTISHDGTILLSGHPKGKILRWNLSASGQASEVADLNAPVTNVMFLPLFTEAQSTKSHSVIKPSQTGRSYTFTAQINSDMGKPSRLENCLATTGFPKEVLDNAINGLQQPQTSSGGDEELKSQNEELWELLQEQRALQNATMQKYIELLESKSNGR